MKKSIIICAMFFICIAAAAQTANLPQLDKSPMDMSYYPAGYPIQKIQNKITEPLAIRVIYSRPQKAGRDIFGKLIPYGEVWRLGANEATEVEFFKTVWINGKKIRKGRYTLYALVNENTWTFIVNNETDIWGAFKYDSKKDITRVEAPVQKNDSAVEALTIVFEKTINGCDLVVYWDTTKVILPIQINK
jgi:hypothetical protein